MNYIQIAKDSLLLFRTTKLIWVLGFLSLTFMIPLNFAQFVRDDPIFACVNLVALLVAFIISFTSNGALVYVIYQAIQNKKVPFSEGWLQGRSKLFRILGLILPGIPFVIIVGFFQRIITAKAPASPLLWLMAVLEIVLLSSFFAFSCCAIIIDNIKLWVAARTSFLIVMNNLPPVFVITVGVLLVRLLLTGLVVAILGLESSGSGLPVPLTIDYPTYQKIIELPIVSGIDWIFDLFLYPLETIMLTYAYLKFTKEVSYPGLAQRQTTA